MPIGQQIKILRKSLKLTQAEFADRLGLKMNTIATYEGGQKVPSGVAFNSICKEYNVRAEWLRDGTGEMYAEDHNLENLSRRHGLSESEHMAVELFIGLAPETRSEIVRCLGKLGEALAATSKQSSWQR
jgi:transcriptional regulator with XRE-family HTH domain